jgi:hypothetical protein
MHGVAYRVGHPLLEDQEIDIAVTPRLVAGVRPEQDDLRAGTRRPPQDLCRLLDVLSGRHMRTVPLTVANEDRPPRLVSLWVEIP